MDILSTMEGVISLRKEKPKEGSYTSYLFNEGLDKILKKVGEESAEVIIASKNSDKNELISELADLCYHILVLMKEKEISLKEIEKELKIRLKK